MRFAVVFFAFILLFATVFAGEDERTHAKKVSFGNTDATHKSEWKGRPARNIFKDLREKKHKKHTAEHSKSRSDAAEFFKKMKKPNLRPKFEL